MDETIKITRKNWNSITVSRNPEYLSGKSSNPFKVIIIWGGEYLKEVSHWTFKNINDAIDHARFWADQTQTNWDFEKGL